MFRDNTNCGIPHFGFHSVFWLLRVYININRLQCILHLSVLTSCSLSLLSCNSLLLFSPSHSLLFRHHSLMHYQAIDGQRNSINSKSMEEGTWWYHALSCVPQHSHTMLVAHFHTLHTSYSTHCISELCVDHCHISLKCWPNSIWTSQQDCWLYTESPPDLCLHQNHCLLQ